MKPETHRGEVAEHVVGPDVELMLQTQREEEKKRMRRLRTGCCRSRRGRVWAWEPEQKAPPSLGPPLGPSAEPTRVTFQQSSPKSSTALRDSSSFFFFLIRTLFWFSALNSVSTTDEQGPNGVLLGLGPEH